MFLYLEDKINVNAAHKRTYCHTAWEPATFNMLIVIILSRGAEQGCAVLLLLLSHTKVTEHKTLRHESVKNENKHMHTLLVGFLQSIRAHTVT